MGTAHLRAQQADPTEKGMFLTGRHGWSQDEIVCNKVPLRIDDIFRSAATGAERGITQGDNASLSTWTR